MTRWRAASIHLCISLAIFLGALVLMLQLWYPHPYFEAIGAAGLLKLLVGVDVVLGPLITLIIFKSGKKGLKLDLSIIGALQFAALLYGMWVVAEVRPAFLVYTGDRFNLVSANEVELSGGRTAEFSSLSWTGPRLAAAQLPKDRDERDKITFASVLHGVDIQHMAKLYEPYSAWAKQAAGKGKSLETLRARGESNGRAVEAFLAERKLPMGSVVYLPLSAKNRDMSLVLSKDTGEILGAIDVDPW